MWLSISKSMLIVMIDASSTFHFLRSKMLSHFSATFLFAICLITLQNYPQYWPSEGTARYGKVTLEMLSETSTNNVTTRKFSVLDAEVCPIIATQLVIRYATSEEMFLSVHS